MECLGPFLISSQPLLAHALSRCLTSAPTLRAYPGLPELWLPGVEDGHSSALLPGAPQSFLLWGVGPACAPGPLIPLNTHCARKAEVPGNPDPCHPQRTPWGLCCSKMDLGKPELRLRCTAGFGSCWPPPWLPSPSPPWDSHQFMRHRYALQEKAPFGKIYPDLSPVLPASASMYSETYLSCA